jgi:hypothetical protein
MEKMHKGGVHPAVFWFPELLFECAMLVARLEKLATAAGTGYN